MTPRKRTSQKDAQAATTNVNVLRRKQAIQALGVRHDSFWAALDRSARKYLMSLGRWKVYAGPHEPIYRLGHTSTHAFVLLGGHVKAVLDVNARHPTMLALHYPGQVLGYEQALQMGGGPPVRATTMQPLHEAYGVVVDSDRFRAFLDAHQTAWEALARELHTRLNESETRLGQQTMEAANRRLAKALASLIDYPIAIKGGFSPTALPLTQAELASWIGVSVQTVERILRDWRNRGIVMTGYRKITVVRLGDLVRISGTRRSRSATPVQAAGRANRSMPRTA